MGQTGKTIIDFHTHTFPDKMAPKTIASLSEAAGVTANTDGTLQGLLHSMERIGITRSVIMPVVTRPEQFQTVNNFAAKTNEMYGDKVISFGGIHPDSLQYKQELDYIKSLGLKGIKLHPDYQRTMINDTKYKHIIDYASQLGLVVLVHAGIDIGIPEPVHCPPEKALEVIEELQPPKMVLAHMGGWKQWDMVEKLLVGKSVYFDTAFCEAYVSKQQMERMIRHHGAKQILFATDSPWEDGRKTIAMVDALNLSDEEKEQIFAGNACRLLGL